MMDAEEIGRWVDPRHGDTDGIVTGRRTTDQRSASTGHSPSRSTIPPPGHHRLRPKNLGLRWLHKVIENHSIGSIDSDLNRPLLLQTRVPMCMCGHWACVSDWLSYLDHLRFHFGRKSMKSTVSPKSSKKLPFSKALSPLDVLWDLSQGKIKLAKLGKI